MPYRERITFIFILAVFLVFLQRKAAFLKTDIDLFHQGFCSQNCKNRQDCTQNYIDNSYNSAAVLKELCRFKGKGGKGGKAATDSNLEKEYQTRIKLHILQSKSGDYAYGKGTYDIYGEGFNRKDETFIYMNKPDQVSQHRTDKSADTDC